MKQQENYKKITENESKEKLSIEELENNCKMNKNNYENKIWEDSEWTVEEEYSSPASINNLKVSNKFINKLVDNKGDIQTARRLVIQWLNDPYEDQKRLNKSANFSNNEDRGFDIKITNQKEEMKYVWKDTIRRASSEKINSKPVEKSWENIWKELQLMSSWKILSQIKLDKE